MHPTNPSTLVRRFFAGLAEYVFETRMGVVDPPLVDYLCDLLVRFIRQETLYQIRDLRGQPILEVAGMLEEAQLRQGLACFNAHRHIGDFTLFWLGVYPEHLARLQGHCRLDHLVSFEAEGKRSYWIASTLENIPDSPPASIFERLSQHFELYAYGLREIRREWERRDDCPRLNPPHLFA